MTIFVPLQKADAAQRLVFGCFDETPDRAKEVFDYLSSKPNFQAWSESMHKASGGKSYGNIRGQHNPKIAAGLLKSIEFDDDNKRINFVAHIVDNQEWAKVEAGVYTGFSPGGRYAKRWRDGDVTRYTAEVGELSIVDVPCNPNAGFMLTKADGSEEQVEFVLAKAYEPGNEATKVRAIELARQANPNASDEEANSLAFRKNYVGKARAELIAEKAEEELGELAKAHGPDEGDHPGEGDQEPAAETSGRTAALDAALAKADAVLGSEQADQPATVIATIAAAMTGTTLAKAATDLPFALPGAEAVALIGADLQQSLAAFALIETHVRPLAKGLYSISDVACSLNSFSWIARDICDEERWEGDSASKLPQQALDIVNALKTFLVALIEEEVAEMLQQSKDGLADVIDVVIDGGDDVVVMELANKIVDLVKADAPLMEKAGARNAKADATRIQTIHDKATELGAACADASAEKCSTLEEENNRLAKSIDGALPRIEQLADTVEAQRAELAKMADKIATLEAQPVLNKGAAFSIDKSEDNGGTLEKTAPEPGSLAAINAMPAGRERQRALDLYAEQSRIRTRNPA
jgi:hypothetical protein